MRFDWYSATVPAADPQVLAEALAAPFGPGGTWRLEKARNGYGEGRALFHQGQKRAALYWGGQVGKHGPHMTAYGETTPLVVSTLRATTPAHRVSRADACQDYLAPGSFEALRRLAEEVALNHGVYAKELAPIKGQEMRGTTVYVGAPKSDVQVCVYEKGKQLRELHRDQEANVHHARIEIRVRPPNPRAKEQLSRLSPWHVWNCATWSRNLSERLGNAGLEAVVMRPCTKSDLDRSLQTMVAQYWRHLVALYEREGGSWRDVGAQLGSMVRDHAATRSRAIPLATEAAIDARRLRTP